MYIAFKVLHILAVIVFLGNISIGLFWKRWADRKNDPKIVAHTIDGIIVADRLFTIPGVILLIIGGVGAALTGGIPILSTGWILWSLMLLIISGLAFGPIARTQRLMSATAHEGIDSGSMSWELYRRFSGVWDLWGSIALIGPIAAAILMIAKPSLPAFHP